MQARRNLTISDDLSNRMRATKRRTNWSKVAQVAFEQELEAQNSGEVITIGTNMNAAVSARTIFELLDKRISVLESKA